MTVTYEEIAKRAFDLWQQKGRPEGREMEHWLEAEKELHKEESKFENATSRSSKDRSALRTPKGENL
jgi:hypothetical protein